MSNAARRIMLTTGKHPFSIEHCCECQDHTLHKYNRCVHCDTPHVAQAVHIPVTFYEQRSRTLNRRQRRHGRGIKINPEAA